MCADEVVLGDHLVEVVHDLLGRRDGRPDPGLEAVAERVQVRVRADPGVAVGAPGPPDAVLGLEEQVGRPGALLAQVVRGADARDARADDEDVDVRARRVERLRGLAPSVTVTSASSSARSIAAAAARRVSKRRPLAATRLRRREWDSNPRYPGGTTVFETVRFGHSRIPPRPLCHAGRDAHHCGGAGAPRVSACRRRERTRTG